MTPTEKRQVEKIRIRQVSGPCEEVQASSWVEADEIISSFSGPGSVETILDFGTEKIEYIYDSMDSAMPLRSAVRRWLEWLANKTRPPWVDEDEWESFQYGQEDWAWVYQEYLDEYEI